MNIVAMGTHIVECVRIARMIQKHGEMFLNRVYTEREIRFCRARKQATEHFARRWAAKEAVLKCLRSRLSNGIGWRDMEIRDHADGSSVLHLAGAAKEMALQMEIADIHLSMSHCRAYAHAFAIAVRRGLSTGETSQ